MNKELSSSQLISSYLDKYQKLSQKEPDNIYYQYEIQYYKQLQNKSQERNHLPIKERLKALSKLKKEKEIKDANSPL